jgi:hypothetical protein
MRPLKFFIIMVSITMLSCNSTDCNNGIQDGNETGIDCGGDCISCPTIVPPTSTESQLEGDWFMDNKIILTDTTYYSDQACQITLTLVTIDGSTQYRAYGNFGICGYPMASGWWINSTTGYVSDQYEILLLTPDSLYLNSIQGYGLWKYYR